MVYRFSINGCQLKSGDVIFTKDGTNSVYSLSYWALGKLIPGEVDHSVLYVGPGGLCVEAGIFGVISFTADDRWDARTMFAERGMLDSFIAASSVLAGRGLSAGDEYAARSFVRAYALGSVGKPYNMNFLQPESEWALYCSQLVYLASGYPFVFGFTVYDAFGTPAVAKSGVLNLPKAKERPLGGHAVMAVGYDDKVKRFTVRNSWGPDWGKKGCFTMPYDYLADRNLSDDFWTVRK